MLTLVVPQKKTKLAHSMFNVVRKTYSVRVKWAGNKSSTITDSKSFSTNRAPLPIENENVSNEQQTLPWTQESRVPRNFWNDVGNQKKFLDWSYNQLKLKQMTDWYHVNYEVIHNRLLKPYPSGLD